ncbi:hypothetical protein YC2023_067011 [Brassica napus]
MCNVLLGFISLDCGSPPNEPPYNDVQTGLTFSTDNGFVQTGKTGKVQKEIESLFPKPVWNLRYFPDGIRNCYTLNVTQGSKYLIRALFVYGGMFEEIIHKPISKTLQNNSIYNTQSGSLRHFRRNYFSTASRTVRYPNDVSDRAWIPNFNEKNWTQVTTNLTVNTSNGYNPPQVVMASASTPISAFASWNFTWLLFPSTTQFYIYMHFAEIQSLQANETREFSVLVNGDPMHERYSPKPLSTETLSYFTPQQCDKGNCIVELLRTSKSTLPPLINAIEIYMVIDFPLLETNQDDVLAIKSIQNTYGLSRISWQGDPCVPIEFLWDGLNCDNSNASEPPIVTYLKKKTPNSADPRTTRSSVPAIMTKNRRFTYSEVVTMTNNFEKILGKGGFGMVYHGTVNGTEQVAVKVLSHSSSQGYKEFKAEVELLLRVHHKNLVRLVGYCDEGENLALIYEYMANGDLREHMSEWVGVMLTEGDIQNIVDPKLHGDYDSGSVWRAVELAMSCLNPSSARRPTMSEVVTELNECLAYENSREGTSQNMTHRVL